MRQNPNTWETGTFSALRLPAFGGAVQVPRAPHPGAPRPPNETTQQHALHVKTTIEMRRCRLASGNEPSNPFCLVPEHTHKIPHCEHKEHCIVRSWPLGGVANTRGMYVIWAHRLATMLSILSLHRQRYFRIRSCAGLTSVFLFLLSPMTIRLLGTIEKRKADRQGKLTLRPCACSSPNLPHSKRKPLKDSCQRLGFECFPVRHAL